MKLLVTKNQYKKFVEFLLKNNEVYGPVLNGKDLEICRIDNKDEVLLDGRVAMHSFKDFFIPPCEELFKYKNNKLI